MDNKNDVLSINRRGVEAKVFWDVAWTDYQDLPVSGLAARWFGEVQKPIDQSDAGIGYIAAVRCPWFLISWMVFEMIWHPLCWLMEGLLVAILVLTLRETQGQRVLRNLLVPLIPSERLAGVPT